MKKPHPYRLRAYHNPEDVPFSAIPPGWRFLYADEAGRPQNKPCRAWLPDWHQTPLRFSSREEWKGDSTNISYIVPIAAP